MSEQRGPFWVWVLGGLLFGFALFGNNLSADLVLDDKILIRAQTDLREPFDLVELFTSRYWDDLRAEDHLYRPLTIFTLGLNWRANRALGKAGDDVVIYHVTNVLLHVLVSLGVLLLALRLGLARPAAALVCGLFLAHPIHTEAVCGLVNRSEMLAAGFGLAFLAVHRSSRFAFLSALPLFLALGSKESAIAYLPLAFVLDVWRGGALSRRALFSWSSAAVAVTAWAVLRTRAIAGVPMHIPEISNPAAAAETGTRILTALAVQFDYLRLLAFPVGLSSDYSHAQVPLVKSLFEPRVLGFVLLALAALFWAWREHRTRPAVWISVLGYALLIGPTSNLLLPVGTIMGERLAYSPSIFFLLLVGLGFERLMRRVPRAATPIAAVALVALSVLTIARNRSWQDEPTFFRAQLQSAPNSAAAHYGYGQGVDETGGDLASAAQHYRRSIEILPTFLDPWNALAIATFRLGDPAAAAEMFAHTTRLEPRYARGHYGLGQCRQEAGDLEGALASYREALRVNPDYLLAYVKSAEVHARRGQVERARELCEEALRRKPDFTLAQQFLMQLR